MITLKELDELDAKGTQSVFAADQFIAALVNFWRNGGRELVRDAERYRWLNAQYDFLAYVTGTDGQKTYRLRCGEPLDKWIDKELDSARRTSGDGRG